MYDQVHTVALVTLLVTMTVEANLAAKPNILIIMADDMGYADIGCYGNGTVRTPNIDSLADEGMKMTQHLAAASVCSPSRAAFMTGRYPVRTGAAPIGTWRVFPWPSAKAGLPSSEITFAEQTKKAGYKNALFGKWHLGVHGDSSGDYAHHPLSQGFDYFYGILSSNIPDIGDDEPFMTSMDPYWKLKLVVTWLVVASTLLFLLKIRWPGITACVVMLALCTLPIYTYYFMLNNLTLLLGMVHRNFDVVEQPIKLAGFSQKLVSEGLEFMENATQSGTPFLIVMSWIHMHVAIETAKVFEGRSSLGRYGDGLEEMDWSVGAMLDGLKKFGVDQNTMVYFTSDHGGHIEIATLGGYNGILQGGKTHGAPDGGIRVPGIVRWPGVIEAKSVTDEPTSLMDIFPLVSDVAGVPIPTDRKYDGKNILPLLKGETSVSPHEFMFHYCDNRLHAARYRPRSGSTTWKYVTHEPAWLPGKKHCRFMCNCVDAVNLATPKLYDMTSDPGETTPIDSSSKLYREIAGLMSQAIDRHIESLDPVETQFSFGKLLPQPHLQPCCNGVFPFNCYCEDQKFAQKH